MARGPLAVDYDTATWQRLVSQRLGRTALPADRLDWSGEQVALAYSGQQQIERVFRGLKDGDWLGWGPMYHWTDRRIRIHVFYCPDPARAEAIWTEGLWSLDLMAAGAGYPLWSPPLPSRPGRREARRLARDLTADFEKQTPGH